MRYKEHEEMSSKPLEDLTTGTQPYGRLRDSLPSTYIAHDARKKPCHLKTVPNNAIQNSESLVELKIPSEVLRCSQAASGWLRTFSETRKPSSLARQREPEPLGHSKDRSRNFAAHCKALLAVSMLRDVWLCRLQGSRRL